MAIKIVTTPLSSAAFLAKAGVPEKDAAAVLANGWKVKVEPNQVTFDNAAGGYKVPCSLNALGGLNAGNSADPSVVKLKLEIKKLVGALKVPQLDENGVPLAVAAHVDPNEPADAVNKAKFTFIKQAEQGLAKGFPEFPKAEMWKAAPTKLAFAKRLYQPVHGSSTTSPRYFLVAATDDLNIAARMNGTTLSVRVEPLPGKSMTAYAKVLKDVGYEVHLGKNYASVHLGVGEEPNLAWKTLGALILGMGLQTRTPAPELKRIVQGAA